MNEYAVAALIVVALFVGANIVSFIFDRREWNGGICRENGLPWTYFDSDSTGARGYRAGDRIAWISYPIDKPVQP